MPAVNFVLTIFGNCFSRSFVTSSPSSVGFRLFASRTTYSRFRMVEMMEA